jgi:hypothetical protein
MQKIPKKTGGGRQKIQIRESGILVAQGKSKRLAAMGKTTPDPRPTETWSCTSEQEPIGGLKPEVTVELNKARVLINDKITTIMNSFPAGRQNKLFNFRFGSVSEIKTMTIKTAFDVLHIDINRVKMKLLAGLDYYGNNTKDDKNQPVL